MINTAATLALLGLIAILCLIILGLLLPTIRVAMEVIPR